RVVRRGADRCEHEEGIDERLVVALHAVGRPDEVIADPLRVVAELLSARRETNDRVARRILAEVGNEGAVPHQASSYAARAAAITSSLSSMMWKSLPAGA